MEVYTPLGILNLFLMLISAFLHISVLYCIWRKKNSSFDILLANAYINNVLSLLVIISSLLLFFISIDYLITVLADLTVVLLMFNHNQSAIQVFLVLQLYLAIRFPLKLKIWITKRKTHIGIAIIYGTMLIIYVAVLLCLRTNFIKLDDILFIASVAMCVNFCISLSAYVCLCTIFIHKHIFAKKEKNDRRMVKYRNTFLIIGVTVVLKVISYTPSVLFYLGVHLAGEDLIFLLSFIDQIITPLLYIFYYH